MKLVLNKDENRIYEELFAALKESLISGLNFNPEFWLKLADAHVPEDLNVNTSQIAAIVQTILFDLGESIKGIEPSAVEVSCDE